MGNGWENFPQEDSDKNMIRKVKIFDLVPGDLKNILGGPICCNYGAATMLVIVPVMLVV